MSAIFVLIATLSVALAAWIAQGGPSSRGRRAHPPVRARRIAPRRPLPLLADLPLVRELKAEGEREGMALTQLAEVPEMLDILTLGLSSGLSFDASLTLYCERFDTPLSELMDQTRLSWSMGVASRAEALASMAERVRASALERFASAVSESLAFGIPLTDTLVRQASAIRADHKRDVEEAIEKVPVKMLVPLGVLVVPAMLLAVLGPLVASALIAVG